MKVNSEVKPYDLVLEKLKGLKEESANYSAKVQAEITKRNKEADRRRVSNNNKHIQTMMSLLEKNHNSTGSADTSQKPEQYLNPPNQIHFVNEIRRCDADNLKIEFNIEPLNAFLDAEEVYQKLIRNLESLIVENPKAVSDILKYLQDEDISAQKFLDVVVNSVRTASVKSKKDTNDFIAILFVTLFFSAVVSLPMSLVILIALGPISILYPIVVYGIIGTILAVSTIPSSKSPQKLFETKDIDEELSKIEKNPNYERAFFSSQEVIEVVHGNIADSPRYSSSQPSTQQTTVRCRLFNNVKIDANPSFDSRPTTNNNSSNSV